jgi:glycosyltransferase involved in cell wall biosynthesis
MDHVVCVSHGQGEKVRRAGVPVDKMAVIHSAIRVERFANPDPAYRDRLLDFFSPHSPPTLIVGAAGRLSPEKGFDVLIDAAALVLAGRDEETRGRGDAGTRGRGDGEQGAASSQDPSPKTQDLSPKPQDPTRIGFILFGNGPLRDALARQIAARGLEGNFILAGFTPDLDRYLPDLDLLVQSSFSEGLPNVILEAMAAQIAVVATAVGGTPETVEDGVTGCLVPAADTQALANAILQILSRPEVRRAMGLAGRERVASQFSFAAQADRYRQLLCACLPRHETAGELASQ